MMTDQVFVFALTLQAIAEEDDLQVHDGASLLTAVQRRELRENSRRKSVELKKERNEAKKQERQAKKDRKKEEKLQRTTERDSQRSTKGSSRLSFQKRGSKIDDDDVQHLIDEEVIQGRDEDHGEFDNLMEPTGQDVVDAPVETRPESVGSTLVSASTSPLPSRLPPPPPGRLNSCAGPSKHSYSKSVVNYTSSQWWGY